jgi:hypothetical protein
LTAGLAVHANVWFYNLGTPAGQFSSQENQIGDQIILAGGGSGATINSFSFELYAKNVASSAQYTVLLYANDGAGGAPSSSLWSDTYQFGNASIPGLDSSVLVTYSSLNISVLTSFTWAISFADLGAGAGADAGLILSTSSPTVGTDYSDCWLNSGSGWGLYVDPTGASVDFLAEFQGNTVPDGSSTITLMGLAMAGLFLTRRALVQRESPSRS